MDTGLWTLRCQGCGESFEVELTDRQKDYRIRKRQSMSGLQEKTGLGWNALASHYRFSRLKKPTLGFTATGGGAQQAIASHEAAKKPPFPEGVAAAALLCKKAR
jgi:hypothetical protein